VDEEQYAEIVARLDALRTLAERTNGRVTDLEGWRVQHTEEHKALTSIVEMAEAIGQIRRAVLFAIPFMTLVGVAIGVAQSIW